MSDDRHLVTQSALRLERAAEALVAEAAQLPPDLVPWKPAADVWSVMEILCHVAEFVPYWTSQTLQIVTRPAEPWGRTHANTDRLDAVGRASERTLADVTDEIRRGARASADVLRSFHDTDFDIEATSRNPRWDRKPASFVVEHLIIEHIEKHLGQVRRNVSQFQEQERSGQ